MYCKGKHSAIAILETLTAGLRGFFAVKLVTFTPKRGRSRVKLDTKLVRPRGILGSRPNDPTPDFHARARISNRKVGSRGAVYGRQNQASLRLMTAVDAGSKSPFASISSDTVAIIRRLRRCSFIPSVVIVIARRKSFQPAATTSVAW
jgi:hypothetical protein